MAFNIDGIVIDRIQYGIAEDFNGNVLYTLTQLQDAAINVTAESKEARDSNGTLIKKFYTGKSGTFTANNAILDFNILAEATGSPKEVASEDSTIIMPAVKTVVAGKVAEIVLPGLVVDGNISVVGLASNGSKLSTDYTKDTAASETTFAVANEEITLPTDTNAASFIVKYDRKVESGIKIVNRSDKFPKTVKLTLKALAIDTCTPDVLRSVLIVLPSFQVSPETEFSLTTEAQLQYSGDLQSTYCGTDKVLYEVYFAEEDIED